MFQMYKEEFPQRKVVFWQATQKLENIIDNLLYQASSAKSSSDLVPAYILPAIGNVLDALMFNRTNKLADGLNLSFDDMKTLTEEVVDMIDKYLLYVYLETRITGEAPVTFPAGYFVIKGLRVFPENIKKYMHINGTEAKALLPEGLLDNLEEDTEVFQTMTCMTVNPFDWGYDLTDFFVSSEVVVISFNYAENKSEIDISGLPEDRMVQIWIPTMNNSVIAELGLDVWDPIYVHLSRNQSLQTSLNISERLMRGAAVHVEIRAVVPDGENFSFMAYLGYGYQPFWYKYDDVLNITDDTLALNHRNYTFFIYNR